MPKEQGNPGERLARSSSKTAKDKSNSATLQASQGGGRRELSESGDKNKRVRHIDSEKDSEKDSGYSGKCPMCGLHGFFSSEAPGTCWPFDLWGNAPAFIRFIALNIEIFYVHLLMKPAFTPSDQPLNSFKFNLLRSSYCEVYKIVKYIEIFLIAF